MSTCTYDEPGLVYDQSDTTYNECGEIVAPFGATFCIDISAVEFIVLVSAVEFEIEVLDPEC